jgi:hypothetical protein
MQYSLKKGVSKGLVSALTMAAAFVALAGFADFTIWELVETYLKPLLGALTVSGLLTMVLNYVKVRLA